MKHTPGPWSVGVYEATESFKAIHQLACVCDPVTLALIAVCGPADDKQSQVDADLMAAAPDLLAALTDALLVMTSPKTTLEEQADAITKARIAINKAEGQK